MKASSQWGYFTAAEARAVGYGYRLQHFHRERGNWLQVDRAIYRFPDFPDSPYEDLIRWALWSRDRRGKTQAVVSHETALSLHELGDVMPGNVHLTVPTGFRKRPPGGCILHRRNLTESDIETHDGFLITTPLRTILDAAESELSPEHLAAAINDAVSRGLVRRSRLLEVADSPRAKERIMKVLATDPRERP